jgi:hypothetical protein
VSAPIPAETDRLIAEAAAMPADEQAAARGAGQRALDTERAKQKDGKR